MTNDEKRAYQRGYNAGRKKVEVELMEHRRLFDRLRAEDARQRREMRGRVWAACVQMAFDPDSTWGFDNKPPPCTAAGRVELARSFYDVIIEQEPTL